VVIKLVYDSIEYYELNYIMNIYYILMLILTTLNFLPCFHVHVKNFNIFKESEDWISAGIIRV
jgi:hypothetical protein